MKQKLPNDVDQFEVLPEEIRLELLSILIQGKGKTIYPTLSKIQEIVLSLCHQIHKNTKEDCIENVVVDYVKLPNGEVECFIINNSIEQIEFRI